MKNLVSFLMCLTVLFSASSFNIDRYSACLNKNQGKIEVIFNRHLEFNDLVKLKLDMSQHGIILDYQKLEFDEFGKLIFISFKVDCKDGFSGSASNFGGVELFNQTRLGFYRDYSEGVESPFGTGTI